VDDTHLALAQLTGTHKTIQIEVDALELLVGELQEQIQELGQLNIIISKFPIQRLHDLQVEMVQEITNKGDTMNQDLERIRVGRSQVQTQYDKTLQQKKEIEG
jgi:hypothetical protein